MSSKVEVQKSLVLFEKLMRTAKPHEPQPWRHINLTREQLRVLFVLSDKGVTSPGEIAKEMGVSKANVTGVIERLVVSGLAHRRENLADRRRQIIILTDKGESKIAQLRDISIANLTEVLEKMPGEDLLCLNRGLEALLRILEEKGKYGHNSN